MEDPNPTPIIAVSVAVQNPETGHFLLVRRGRPPAKDLWAFPGGRVHFGETLETAAGRELAEETGLTAKDIRFHGFIEIVDLDGDFPHHFVLAVHHAQGSGTPVAGDDAAEAGWFGLAEMTELPVTASTLSVARAISAEAPVKRL
jgi:8-oxo-dGTP diphosphatase